MWRKEEEKEEEEERQHHERRKKKRRERDDRTKERTSEEVTLKFRGRSLSQRSLWLPTFRHFAGVRSLERTDGRRRNELSAVSAVSAAAGVRANQKWRPWRSCEPLCCCFEQKSKYSKHSSDIGRARERGRGFAIFGRRARAVIKKVCVARRSKKDDVEEENEKACELAARFILNSAEYLSAENLLCFMGVLNSPKRSCSLRPGLGL